MAEKKTKEAKYEDLLKAMSEGEFGMAKFLWDRIEEMDGCVDDSEEKIVELQKKIDAFISEYEDPEDGETPSDDKLLKLIKPLIPAPLPGVPGPKPSKKELMDLIIPMIPEPSDFPPGKPGKPGKPGERGKNGRMPKHEWNGTFIRFEIEPGVWGEWKNLQGPSSVGSHESFGDMSGSITVRNGNQTFEGVTSIKFGTNLTVTRSGSGIVVDASGGGSGSTLTFETPGGTVNDSNTTFTVVNQPLYIVVNGAQYFAGVGYTYTPGQIDLNFPVGQNGFIRSAYNS